MNVATPPKKMRCKRCRNEWTSHSASTRCHKCGNVYVVWTNFSDWQAALGDEMPR